MPRDRGDAAYLLDMIQAGESVIRYVAGKTRAEYDGNEMLRDAVERKLEIIGEAARRLSEVLRDAHPEIAWRKIMAARHILAHDYDDVNQDIVWEIATKQVPQTLTLLRPLVPPIPPDPEPEDDGG